MLQKLEFLGRAPDSPLDQKVLSQLENFLKTPNLYTGGILLVGLEQAENHWKEKSGLAGESQAQFCAISEAWAESYRAMIAKHQSWISEALQKQGFQSEKAVEPNFSNNRMHLLWCPRCSQTTRYVLESFPHSVISSIRDQRLVLGENELQACAACGYVHRWICVYAPKMETPVPSSTPECLPCQEKSQA